MQDTGWPPGKLNLPSTSSDWASFYSMALAHNAMSGCGWKYQYYDCASAGALWQWKGFESVWCWLFIIRLSTIHFVRPMTSCSFSFIHSLSFVCSKVSLSSWFSFNCCTSIDKQSVVCHLVLYAKWNWIDLEYEPALTFKWLISISITLISLSLYLTHTRISTKGSLITCSLIVYQTQMDRKNTHSLSFGVNWCGMFVFVMLRNLSQISRSLVTPFVAWEREIDQRPFRFSLFIHPMSEWPWLWKSMTLTFSELSMTDHSISLIWPATRDLRAVNWIPPPSKKFQPESEGGTNPYSEYGYWPR